MIFIGQQCFQIKNLYFWQIVNLTKIRMKKIIVTIALSVAIFSCNKAIDAKEFKTAYIDTSKLMEESTESKDIEAKYKSKAEVMDSKLKVEAQ